MSNADPAITEGSIKRAWAVAIVVFAAAVWATKMQMSVDSIKTQIDEIKKHAAEADDAQKRISEGIARIEGSLGIKPPK